MDALQMSNLKFKMYLHKDQIWSITYKTKVKAYSVLKTRQGNYAFRLARSLLPWNYRTRPFLDTLLGHPILYMPLKNPPKTSNKVNGLEILQFEKSSNLHEHLGLRQENQNFLRYPLLQNNALSSYMDTFYHIGHVGSTFRGSNFR